MLICFNVYLFWVSVHVCLIQEDLGSGSTIEKALYKPIKSKSTTLRSKNIFFYETYKSLFNYPISLLTFSKLSANKIHILRFFSSKFKRESTTYFLHLLSLHMISAYSRSERALIRSKESRPRIYYLSTGKYDKTRV